MGQKLPGKINCLFLEIITEGKIAQHLKKCVVASGITDIVEIIVFAACAYTFLRTHRTRHIGLLVACKIVFERHHSRIREQKRRIVQWH